MEVKQSVETTVEEGRWKLCARQNKLVISFAEGESPYRMHYSVLVNPNDAADLLMCLNQLRLLWKGEE
jgi:hypothetical protein